MLSGLSQAVVALSEPQQAAIVGVIRRVALTGAVAAVPVHATGWALLVPAVREPRYASPAARYFSTAQQAGCVLPLVSELLVHFDGVLSPNEQYSDASFVFSRPVLAGVHLAGET